MPTEPAAVPPHRGAPWEERHRVARRLVARRAPQGLVRIGLRERVPPARVAVWSARLELRDLGGAPDPEAVAPDLVRVWQLLNQHRDEGVVASSHGAPVVLAWLLASVDAGDWERFLAEELVVLPADAPYRPWPQTVPDRQRLRIDPVGVALVAAIWTARGLGWLAYGLVIGAAVGSGFGLLEAGLPAGVALLGGAVFVLGLLASLFDLASRTSQGALRNARRRFGTALLCAELAPLAVLAVALVAALFFPVARAMLLGAIPLTVLSVLILWKAETARSDREHRVRLRPRPAVRRLVAARTP